MKHYKEIWFGLFFGLGAVGIDLLMHSRDSHGAGADLGDMGTIVFRSFFVIFGLAIGWLMWRNAQRERQFRALEDRHNRYQAIITPAVTILYAKTQILLSQSNGTDKTRQLLESLHSDVQKLKSSLD